MRSCTVMVSWPYKGVDGYREGIAHVIIDLTGAGKWQAFRDSTPDTVCSPRRQRPLGTRLGTPLAAETTSRPIDMPHSLARGVHHVSRQV